MFNLTVNLRQSAALKSLQTSYSRLVVKYSTENELDTTSPKYTAEEINRIRDKSRLPEQVKKAHFEEELPKLDKPNDYRLYKLRGFYGRYGKASGLNPGLCWPTADELEHKMEYKKLAHPPLQEMISRLKRRKSAESEAMLKRERNAEENIKKLISMNREMEETNAANAAAVKAQQSKKEQLIDEVRSFFGYNLPANDPRVQALIERRLEEKKMKTKTPPGKKRFGKKEELNYTKQLSILSQRKGKLEKEKAEAESDSDDEKSKGKKKK